MASTEVPPLLQGPTAKERKYDRQLRLWAASGQAALEEAHVLLVNSGAPVVGVEALKNLVLPGIGQFTIVDDAVVKEEDLGVNFFLEEESLGKSRAEETTRLLCELNPDVKGNAVVENGENFLSKEDSLTPYTLIIITASIKSEILRKVSKHGQASRVPIFYIHSVGFYASFSVQLPQDFPIVDTHPDPITTTDLRLLLPWPALLEYASLKTKNLESMDDHEHGHVPYLILILYYLDEWKKSHDGKLPSNFKEKNEFKKLIQEGMRLDNPTLGEENYEQAVAAVLKNVNEPTPNSAVKEVFNAEECQNLTPVSSSFWVISHAVSQFYKRHGVLPLPGSVPDMKAQSTDYIDLQNVYKTKAREDAKEVLDIVRSLEMGLYRTNQINEKEVEAFCKSAGHIKLIRGRPLQIWSTETSEIWRDRAKFAKNSISDETSLILLQIAFLAYDQFYETHGIAPGLKGYEDSQELTSFSESILNGLFSPNDANVDEEKSEALQSLSDISKELVRAGGGELHNMSALAGGLVAQEVIKVVTKQYVPVDNTCLFDGIKSITCVIKL